MIVVLIYISLMISDVESLLMNLFCVSLGKCLSIFKSNYLIFFLLSYMSFLHVLDINTLSDT